MAKTKKKSLKGKGQARTILTTEDKDKLGTAVREGGLKLSWVKFIDAYIENGGNGSKAYQKAYSTDEKQISESVARSAAARLLTNVSILEEIDNKLTTQQCTEEFIVSGLVGIARDYRGAKTIMAAVRSYEILAKVKGLLVDTKKIAFTGENPALFPALVKPDNKEKWDKETDRISE